MIILDYEADIFNQISLFGGTNSCYIIHICFELEMSLLSQVLGFQVWATMAGMILSVNFGDPGPILSSYNRSI